jgi:hypothetical protein
MAQACHVKNRLALAVVANPANNAYPNLVGRVGLVGLYLFFQFTVTFY